jgi:hypothetical protein
LVKTLLRSSTAKEEQDFGRKVDLLFYIDDIELANVEFKVQKTTPMEIKIQHLKNIRINRAIMEGQLKTCDARTSILYMDIQGTQLTTTRPRLLTALSDLHVLDFSHSMRHTVGWNGSLFALYGYDDIFVSKLICTISLPVSEAGMETFLSNEDPSLDYLLYFTVRIYWRHVLFRFNENGPDQKFGLLLVGLFEGYWEESEEGSHQTYFCTGKTCS